MFASIALSLSAISAFGQTSPKPPADPAAQIAAFEEQYAAFEKECVKDGKLRAEIDWCVAEKARLESEYERLQRVMHAAEDSTESASAKECANCEVLAREQNKTLDQGLEKAIREAVDKAGETECKTNTKVLSAQCFGEIGCELMKMAVPSVFKYTLGGYSPKNSCLAGLDHQTGCFEELAHGLFDDIWGNIKAITYEIPKMIGKAVVAAGRAIKDAAARLWDSIWGIEDKTSDAQVTATQTSDESLAQWFRNKIDYVKNFFSSFLGAVSEGIRTSYGCAEWSGAPHFSTCKKPMVAWDCATCGQRFTAICGVVGYLGGEIVSSFLTGGATAVVSTVSKSAGKLFLAGEKALEVAAKTNKAARVAKTAVKAVKTVGKVTLTAAKIPFKVLKAGWDAIGKKLKALNASKAANATKATLAYRAVAKGTSIAVYPANAYFRKLNEAFNKGYSATSRLAFAKGLTQKPIYVAISANLSPGQKLALPAPAAELGIESKGVFVTEDNVIRFRIENDGANDRLVVESVSRRAGAAPLPNGAEEKSAAISPNGPKAPPPNRSFDPNVLKYPKTVRNLSSRNVEALRETLGPMTTEESKLVSRIESLTIGFHHRVDAGRLEYILDHGGIGASGKSGTKGLAKSKNIPDAEKKLYGADRYVFGWVGPYSGTEKYGAIVVNVKPEYWKAKSWATRKSGYENYMNAETAAAGTKPAESALTASRYDDASKKIVQSARRDLESDVIAPNDYSTMSALTFLETLRKRGIDPRTLAALDGTAFANRVQEIIADAYVKDRVKTGFFEGKIPDSVPLDEIESVTVPADPEYDGIRARLKAAGIPVSP